MSKGVSKGVCVCRVCVSKGVCEERRGEEERVSEGNEREKEVRGS